MLELALHLIRENIEKHNRGEDALSLDLGNCGLTELPEKVLECGWLEELILSNDWREFNPFSNGWIDKRSKNRGRENKIKNIFGVEKLISLKILIVACGGDSRWDLDDLSPLKFLKNLEILDVRYTKVSNLEPLRDLKNLQRLYVSASKVNDLSCLSGLHNIQHFRAHTTRISKLTPLQGLDNLRLLDISNTQVEDLSPILSLVKKGVLVEWKREGAGILLKNCPLTNPPIETVKQGNAAILEYFRQKEKTGEDLLLEAKVILLGDGRSGKTSLANRLLGKPLPTEADRTQGVDIIIGEYEFEIANERKFKLHLWDFAGQDKYKPLHQFFYTESSLYIMVAESGNARTDFDDWLQTAELFGEGSPLIVVLNEFRDGIGFGSFDREIWQKRFPNLLKDVFVVNLGTKRGFDTLEHQIRLLSQSLPHTQYPYPKNWADIRRALELRRDENFISLQEYFKICRENLLPEKQSALILGQVLHKIGVCLHYQKSDLLKQFVILKNEWATGAVYKILDDATVAEVKKGFFDRSDLERIWSDEEYSDMRPQLLELMQQFKMAYPLPGNQQFVTPPLLPAAPPEDWKWSEKDALELYIEYEFLPKALLTQFIVTRHNDIDQGKTLVWRNGVVLRWLGEALGEVSKTKLQGKDAFYIRTAGRDRKGLMTVILKTFRELHDDYRGIKSEEKVPCPCDGCRTGKNKQHYYKFEYLKRRLEKGFFEETCAESESFETINSLKLLENHFVFEKIQAGKPLLLKRDLGQKRRDEAQKFGPLKVFISYSKHDRDKFLVPMTRYLNPLMRGGLLDFWDDSKILPGEEWDEKIKSEIEKADVIFLLVSTNSLNTEYIWNVEIHFLKQTYDSSGQFGAEHPKVGRQPLANKNKARSTGTSSEDVPVPRTLSPHQ